VARRTRRELEIGESTTSTTPSRLTVTAADRVVVDRLVIFAREPSRRNLAALPLKPRVGLGLGSDLLRQVDRAALGDPDAWLLVRDGFRAYVGPFSAIEHLQEPRPTAVNVGEHVHYASPPMPPPPGLAGLRRVSVQPINGQSCLDWFTVDLFVGEDGLIAAVTLDLWEP
jgi:hypothetical protein